MKKISLILVNEIITVITRPSFRLAAVGIPLIGAVSGNRLRAITTGEFGLPIMRPVSM